MSYKIRLQTVNTDAVQNNFSTKMKIFAYTWNLHRIMVASCVIDAQDISQNSTGTNKASFCIICENPATISRQPSANLRNFMVHFKPLRRSYISLIQYDIYIGLIMYYAKLVVDLVESQNDVNNPHPVPFNLCELTCEI